MEGLRYAYGILARPLFGLFGARRASSERLSDSPLYLPRNPIVGWHNVSGARRASVPDVSTLPHIVLATSGRAAIALALDELGIGHGERVLVPSFHCPTMVSPIVARGARPVFFPIGRAGTPLIDRFDGLDIAGARAMLAVHYFGIPRDLGATREFCDRHGIALLEDCAHAYFGAFGGRPVGTWGDLAIASLTKFFPVVEGGCLVSARRPIARSRLDSGGMVHDLRQALDMVEIAAHYGRLQPLSGVLRAIFGFKRRIRHRPPLQVTQPEERLPANDDGTAAFDRERVHRRPAATTRLIVGRSDRARIAERRRSNYTLLSRQLDGVRGLTPLTPELPDGAVPYVFPLHVSSPERSYQAVRRAGVPIFRWDVLWPGVPQLRDDVGTEWATHVFQLACHQDLAERDICAIAGIVRRIAQSPA